MPQQAPRRRPAFPQRPSRAAVHYLRRRRLVAAGLGSAVARPAQAQSGAPWPQRPVRLLLGSAPGGGPDIAARLLARSWTAMLGQPAFVENRVGANGGLAMESVARAGDGHTLLFGTTGNFAINNALFPALALDSLRDFTPVGLLVESPFFLAIAPRLPAGSLAAFVAHARAHPGTLNYGSPGIGTSQHLAFEQFRRALGLDIAHIPYRGITGAMQDLAAGRIDFVIDVYPGIRAAEAAGTARVLAVTAAAREARRPEVPTVAEAAGLPGYQVLAWMALMAPAGTPDATLRIMEAALAAAVQGGDLAQALEQAGLPPRFLDRAATRAFIEAERARYGALIRDAGIRPTD